MINLFEDEFGETAVHESDDGKELIVDVTGLSCPEYTMQFISLCKMFHKQHSSVVMKCTAPSIADQQTQHRISFRTNLTITKHNINFTRTNAPVKINRDSPLIVEFSA